MTGIPEKSAETAMFTKTVKVMSFNIQHGKGMDGVVDLKRTAEVIRTSGADVIGIQEVDSHFSERSRNEDQASRLAEMLGMDYSYGPNLIAPPLYPGASPRQYGNAVLSRFPIKYAVNHPFIDIGKPPEDPEPRGMLETVIDFGGTYLNFYNTHLSLSESQFRDNIRQLISLAEKSVFPMVITGDFNAKPDHPEFEKMRGSFNDIFAESGLSGACTYPSRYVDDRSGERFEPVSRIDYIFADKDAIIRSAEVLDTSAADHLPIVAELDIVLSGRAETTGVLNAVQ